MDIHSLNAKENCCASSIVYGRVPTKGLNDHLRTATSDFNVVLALLHHYVIALPLHRLKP